MITIAQLALASFCLAPPVDGPQVAIEETKLTALEHVEGDWLGGAVAVSGDTAVVGMYRDNDADPETSLRFRLQ